MIPYMKLSLIILALVLNTDTKRSWSTQVHFKSGNFEALYKALIPQGCYGQRQIREILTHNTLTVKHKPIAPEWCSEDEPLIPLRLRVEKPQTSKPPYKFIVERFPKTKNIFKVILKRQTSHVTVKDATVVARPIHKRVVAHNNRGRFFKTPGVQLMCCSLYDKDVARFTTDDDNVEKAEFRWTPYEELTDDFEGNITFIATVASNNDEYWINVTSKPMRVTSSDFKMFS